MRELLLISILLVLSSVLKAQNQSTTELEIQQLSDVDIYQFQNNYSDYQNAVLTAQDGVNNVINLNQTGGGLGIFPNLTLVGQKGDDNSANLNQSGSENGIILFQQGDANTANVEQNGVANLSVIYQRGDENSATINEKGWGNMSMVYQTGNDNHVWSNFLWEKIDIYSNSFYQTGNNNQILVEDSDKPIDGLKIEQVGNNMMIHFNQSDFYMPLK